MDRPPSPANALALALLLALPIVALLATPSFAVTGRHYRYSVRHEKGASPFFPFTPVENETVNSANGNLFFSIPLLGRPGRNGLGLDLMLAYNSKI